MSYMYDVTKRTTTSIIGTEMTASHRTVGFQQLNLNMFVWSIDILLSTP